MRITNHLTHVTKKNLRRKNNDSTAETNYFIQHYTFMFILRVLTIPLLGFTTPLHLIFLVVAAVSGTRA